MPDQVRHDKIDLNNYRINNVPMMNDSLKNGMNNITSFGYNSDVGASRERNEDNFCVIPEIGLWAVADGMGGYKGGQTASRMTIEKLSDDVRNGIPMTESIAVIHNEILSAAESDAQNQGMGSTVVAMKTNGFHYEIAWVGDSRAYLWDGVALQQLTRDHSYIQYLLGEGAITEKEAATHPQRHAVYQALGGIGLKKVDVDVVYGIFHQNEKILLCSDGLTTDLNDHQIAAILADEQNPQAVIDALIDAVNNNGGSDNVTAILVTAPEDAPIREVGGDTEPLKTVFLKKDKKKVQFLLQWMAALIILLMGAAVWLYWK
jgi:PPM family protein phosphatase